MDRIEMLLEKEDFVSAWEDLYDYWVMEPSFRGEYVGSDGQVRKLLRVYDELLDAPWRSIVELHHPQTRTYNIRLWLLECFSSLHGLTRMPDFPESEAWMFAILRESGPTIALIGGYDLGSWIGDAWEHGNAIDRAYHTELSPTENLSVPEDVLGSDLFFSPGFHESIRRARKRQGLEGSASTLEESAR